MLITALAFKYEIHHVAQRLKNGDGCACVAQTIISLQIKFTTRNLDYKSSTIIPNL